MSVRLQLSEAIYPRKCLDEAIATYSGLCSVEVSEVSSQACIIEIKPSGDIEAEGDRVAHEFMNYLLDLSLENHLRPLQDRRI
jgi:hypothetical protein